MKNKITMRVSRDFYDFIEKVGANRVKVGIDKRTIPLCQVPDFITRYFKLNNDRYLELVNLEGEDGDN